MKPMEIAPGEALALVAEGRALLVDVREPAEFGAGHIPYAVSIPLGRLRETLAAHPFPGPVIFQCQKGGRGGQACVVAAEVGGADIRNLAGGIEAWRAAGLPVVGGGAQGVPIFRQVQIVVGLAIAASCLSGFAGWLPGFGLAAFFGAMLAVAGITGWCGMAILLQRMPWNRPA